MGKSMYDSKVGALWKRTSNKGTAFLSGKITVGEESYDIVVFKNNSKKTEKHPDYEVFSDALAELNKAGASSQKGKEDSDDIPF